MYYDFVMKIRLLLEVRYLLEIKIAISYKMIIQSKFEDPIASYKIISKRYDPVISNFIQIVISS